MKDESNHPGRHASRVIVNVGAIYTLGFSLLFLKKAEIKKRKMAFFSLPFAEVVLALSQFVSWMLQQKYRRLSLAYFLLFQRKGDLVFQEEIQLVAEHRLVHHGHRPGAV